MNELKYNYYIVENGLIREHFSTYEKAQEKMADYEGKCFIGKEFDCYVTVAQFIELIKECSDIYNDNDLEYLIIDNENRNRYIPFASRIYYRLMPGNSEGAYLDIYVLSMADEEPFLIATAKTLIEGLDGLRFLGQVEAQFSYNAEKILYDIDEYYYKVGKNK